MTTTSMSVLGYTHLRPLNRQISLCPSPSSHYLRNRSALHPNAALRLCGSIGGRSVDVARPLSSSQPVQGSRRREGIGKRSDWFDEKIKSVIRSRNSLARAYLTKIRHIERLEPNTGSRGRKIARLQADIEFEHAQAQCLEVFRTLRGEIDAASPTPGGRTSPSLLRVAEWQLEAIRHLVTAKWKSVSSIVFAPQGEVHIVRRSTRLLGMLAEYAFWVIPIWLLRIVLWYDRSRSETKPRE